MIDVCHKYSRRHVVAGASGIGLLGALPPLAFAADEGAIKSKPIPVSGETLPVVGLGTVAVFNFENDPEKLAQRKLVVQAMIAAGAKVIDSAASYGNAEARVGDVVSELNVRNKVFLATKFDSHVPRDMQLASFQESLRRMKTKSVDLMQAWNVDVADFSLAPLREWKAQGLCRYTGITSSYRAAYEALAPVLKREKPDFFQINYSIADREAEKVLLPLAKESGAAVFTDMPFAGGRNSLFKKVAGKPLPEWAAEFDAKTWSHFFLKFLLSHPAVNTVIPGTDNPEHMLDNLGAGRGRLPDAAMRKRMADYWDALV